MKSKLQSGTFSKDDLVLCDIQPPHYNINEFAKGQRVALGSCHDWKEIPWMEVLKIDNMQIMTFYQNEIHEFHHLCLIIHSDDLKQ